jgi:dipeptidyl aminopeptidase/acylaminoacyl peptidase
VDITTPSSWGDSGLAQNVKEFIGNTGDLAVLETQDYFEVMRVGLSSATSFPIVRTVWDGADTLFSQLLFVPGGLGVYGFVYSSITQNAAWIDAVSGQMQMRIAPFRQLSGQSSEEMGTVLLTTSSDGVTGGLAFAPNGQQLVASLCIASCSALNKGTDLFVLNAATGQVIQRLTTDGDAGISAVQPRWSPDGQWIVFVSNKSGNNEIWLIHPDGTGAEQVTANGLDNSGPSWSPDSKSLAFAINNNGAYSIWLASLRNGSTWPAISSLSPSSATAGGGAFKLSVAGFGFVSGSSVHWNGMSLPTTFVSAAQLAAQVSAAQIASQGTASVTVSNPGGATSAATFFSINSGSVITSLSPSSAKTGGGAFVPTVDGASFVSNSEVQWNGAAVPTASVNVARLNASVAASQIASPGAANITVLNPGRGSPPATAFLVNK